MIVEFSFSYHYYTQSLLSLITFPNSLELALNTRGNDPMKSTNQQRRRKVTYEKTYEGHPINTGKTKSLGCDMKILAKIKAVMDDAVARHKDTQMLRIDFHLPETVQDEDANRVMSDLVGEVVRTFNRPRSRDLPETREALDATYVMTREQNTAERPHFHAAFFLDKARCWPKDFHIEEIKEITARKLGDPSMAYDCKNSHAIIKRYDPSSYDEAFYICSYLAKVKSKDATNVREVMSSQVKPPRKAKPNDDED